MSGVRARDRAEPSPCETREPVATGAVGAELAWDGLAGLPSSTADARPCCLPGVPSACRTVFLQRLGPAVRGVPRNRSLGHDQREVESWSRGQYRNRLVRHPCAGRDGALGAVGMVCGDGTRTRLRGGVGPYQRCESTDRQVRDWIAGIARKLCARAGGRRPDSDELSSLERLECCGVHVVRDVWRGNCMVLGRLFVRGVSRVDLGRLKGVTCD